MATSSDEHRESQPEPQISSVPKTDNDTSSSPPSTTQESGVSTPPTEFTQVSLQDPPALDAAKKAAAPKTEEQTQAVRRVPFEHPLPECEPIRRGQLTQDQETKYKSLLTTVSNWLVLPTTTTKTGKTEPLQDHERMFLTRECLLRYLRATNWSTKDAANRLQGTLVWRREFGADKITADDVSEENETGKQVLLGYDNDARPCLYLDPARQNTKKSDRQIQHLVYMLDRTIDMMDPGQETTALLINFKNSSAGGNPSVGQGRQVLTILQGHYPERLGKALISDLPWYVTTFFKLIAPFIDPVTRSKMIFNQPLRNTYVPAAHLWKNYNGDANFEYDHGTYWPALADMCARRREAYRQRWEQGGKRMGEFEEYLRGGEQKSLSEVEKKTEQASS